MNAILKKLIELSRPIIFSVFLFMFMNCASSQAAYHDADLQPYIDEYVTTAELFGHNQVRALAVSTEIRIAPQPDDTLGTCYYYLNRIVINENFWKDARPENKEEIVFHEMRHCMFGESEHTKTGIFRAKGLYNPVYYRQNYKRLMNEFFGCTTGDCFNLQWKWNKYESNKKERGLTKEELLNNEHAVVRFTAPWCPPCKLLAPVFDEVAAANSNVKIYVVNVDENQDLARDMNVRGIPMLVKIKDKKVVDTLVGNQPREKIEEMFK